MTDILSFAFMQNALVASLLASIACGVIGSLVVINRMVFLAGGVAHTAYGGVGLAFFLGLPVLPCTLGFTALASVGMSWATRRRSDRNDTIIGLMWAAGMAFGIILLDLTPGYNVDLMSFLFGSILAVPAADLWVMAAMDVVTLAIVLHYYNAFLSMSFDREFARSRGNSRDLSAFSAAPAHQPVHRHDHPGGGTYPGHRPAHGSGASGRTLVVLA